MEAIRKLTIITLYLLECMHDAVDDDGISMNFYVLVCSGSQNLGRFLNSIEAVALRLAFSHRHVICIKNCLPKHHHHVDVSAQAM
jgi:hypothetical protein